MRNSIALQLRLDIFRFSLAVVGWLSIIYIRHVDIGLPLPLFCIFLPCAILPLLPPSEAKQVQWQEGGPEVRPIQHQHRLEFRSDVLTDQMSTLMRVRSAVQK